LKIKIAVLSETLVICTVSGELSIFDEDFDIFQKEVVAYIKLGVYRFIVDLDAVSYIDSSGIGVIIRLATNAMKKETQVCVICNQPHVKRVFSVANVDRIMKFVDSVDEGIAFFERTTGFVNNGK
jgi:stage II sporulation protein AA (anti-sigma F factor antagonist)